MKNKILKAFSLGLFATVTALSLGCGSTPTVFDKTFAYTGDVSISYNKSVANDTTTEQILTNYLSLINWKETLGDESFEEPVDTVAKANELIETKIKAKSNTIETIAFSSKKV